MEIVTTDSKIGFLHVPRTGGTYLESLLSSMGSERFVNFFGIPNNQIINKHSLIECIEKQGKIQSKNIANCELFSGHFSLNIEKFLPFKAKYFTIIRDPVYRVASFVKKVLSSNSFKEVMVRDCSIGDTRFWSNFFTYIESGSKLLMTHEQHGFSNYYTKVLSGSNLDEEFEVDDELYNQALQNLDKFIYIGRFDRYEETLEHILDMFEINSRYTIKNRVEHTLDDYTRDRLTRMNEYDVKLYNHLIGE